MKIIKDFQTEIFNLMKIKMLLEDNKNIHARAVQHKYYIRQAMHEI